MKTIYCISGLGANKTAFQKIHFPQNYSVIYVEWLIPFENESLENYSKRFSASITENLPIIIGLSFGGIMAQFITKHIPTERLILISSTKSSENIPSIRKIFRYLPFHKLIPDFLYFKTNFIVYYLFGLKSSKGKLLLSQIFKISNLIFVKWAIQKLINIDSITKADCPIFQIHGDNDKLFPLKLQKSEFIVKNGGHFMVYENAEVVSSIINSILEKSN
jgi:pimeloyl-ACP methyl ester carboxylesterase